MKTPVTVTIDNENLKKIDEDRHLAALGRSGIVRLALSEFYQRREENGERKTDGKHREHEHR